MKRIVTITLLIGIFYCLNARVYYLGKSPEKALIYKTKTGLVIENRSLKLNLLVRNKTIQTEIFENKETGKKINWRNQPWFYLALKNGDLVESNDFVMTEPFTISSTPVSLNSTRQSDRINGKNLAFTLFSKRLNLTLRLTLSLKDESNYIRQQFQLIANDSILVEKIGLISFPLNRDIKSGGVVDGSPLFSDDFFCAIEHPTSKQEFGTKNISLYIRKYESIKKMQPVDFSCVWGVSPVGQQRRSFLYYLERERVVPYRQQLHYNSWFDISWEDRKLNESICLDRIQAFADSLISKRNVKMNAFLFDDGWDNNQTLWQFNSGFPNGFSKLKELTSKYNSTIGVWISPWGGYDTPKIQRLEYGKIQNPPFETNENGFSLSGKVYRKRFFDVVTNFVKSEGVSMFKFDGVGVGNDSEGAGEMYEKDINALLKLIPDLRIIKPDLYFSLTVGTWPSPFWLFYGDAIWRNGDDTGFLGEGSKRQQWLNYRDSETYKNIVNRGKFYPLNSIMYHGICIADNGRPDSMGLNDSDICDEIWSFFGTGTSLQEMYINPHLLKSTSWNCLAKAINWAKSNESIMTDTHWVGGSPADGEVYGFASWSPTKSVLTLRNPSSQSKSILINASEVFELPNSEKQNFNLKGINHQESYNLTYDRNLRLELKPFEVKVFDAFPTNK